MATLLQAGLGGALALAVVAGIFWLTFRDPPATRTDDAVPGRIEDDPARLWPGDGHGGLP